jgi:hypothetical protein
MSQENVEVVRSAFLALADRGREQALKAVGLAE